jgi:hypothetical protein
LFNAEIQLAEIIQPNDQMDENLKNRPIFQKIPKNVFIQARQKRQKLKNGQIHH